jgi:WD40 repeat protein
LFALCLGVSAAKPASAQVESVAGPAPQPLWTSHGRVEGHLALHDSPDGAFSPDSQTLAVVSDEKIVLMDLAAADVRKVLKLHIEIPANGKPEPIRDLRIQSANYISPTRLFILANGLIERKDGGVLTPEIGFQWYIDQDSLYGKVDAIGAGGGFGPPRYFPDYQAVGLYKDSVFTLWNPNSGRAQPVKIADLTRRPNLWTFSPDGHWLLLAQLEASGTADPIVVLLKEHKFADSLRGHQGTVLGMSFSRDSRLVATACEDGKVRIWSEGDWKLLQTLSGHAGAVHWAEFSPDGQWLASAGEDKTVRVWNTANGQLVQKLSESREPVLTVAFSPNGQYIAGSTENTVLVWQRQ